MGYPIKATQSVPDLDSWHNLRGEIRLDISQLAERALVVFPGRHEGKILEVIDISMSGLGGLGSVKVRRGDVLQLELSGTSERVWATVRFCLFVQGQFRVGFSLSRELVMYQDYHRMLAKK